MKKKNRPTPLGIFGENSKKCTPKTCENAAEIGDFLGQFKFFVHFGCVENDISETIFLLFDKILVALFCILPQESFFQSRLPKDFQQRTKKKTWALFLGGEVKPFQRF